MQKVSWLIQPMNVIIQQHLKTLADYPPVQGGESFDMPNLIADFLAKGNE